MERITHQKVINTAGGGTDVYSLWEGGQITRAHITHIIIGGLTYSLMGAAIEVCTAPPGPWVSTTGRGHPSPTSGS